MRSDLSPTLTRQPTMDCTVVSCPGKVLLAGGYLVLSADHQGFVVSTPSRFYTVVQSMPLDIDARSQSQFSVTVKSPQFVDGEWVYEAAKGGETGEWTVVQDASNGAPRNPFVQLAVQSTLLLATALSSQTRFSDLVVTIVGANDFYSQSRQTDQHESFAHLGVKIKDVHKTGLGSSAAMVTSLCGALLLHWDKASRSAEPVSNSVEPISIQPAASSTQNDAKNATTFNVTSPTEPTILSSSPPPPALFPHPQNFDVPDKDTLSLIHNLSQYVHSLAQGKVGSGFDVSAAVYGSHVYRRFAVDCLGGLLEDKDAASKTTSAGLLKVLSPMMNPLWTKKSTAALVSPFALPPKTMLILADVDAGSNTPSMVGKVLSWKRQQSQQADELWNELRKVNADLAESFASLSRAEKEGPQAYNDSIQALSTRTSNEWNSPLPFEHSVKYIKDMRNLMRRMGESSGVPIEPPEQTRLLDACAALPGVIGAGVPGAGGYDAVWVLVLCPSSDPSTTGSSLPEHQVEQLLRSWSEMSVRPLSRQAWIKGGVNTIETGLLEEQLDAVPGLRRVVAGF
ncbi:phosphomevalonate kinase [Microbotryomycetes sp. JL201]|nr:phosphomevalonate kinase [Microbotryomycetes sp. JL201]